MTVAQNIATANVLKKLVRRRLTNPDVPMVPSVVLTDAVLTPENVVCLVPIRSLPNRQTLLILILLVMTEKPNKSKPGGSVIPVTTRRVAPVKKIVRLTHVPDILCLHVRPTEVVLLVLNKQQPVTVAELITNLTDVTQVIMPAELPA